MKNKEYEKTVYTRYRLPFGQFPENLVSAQPIRLFGFVVLLKCRLATKDYKWEY